MHADDGSGALAGPTLGWDPLADIARYERIHARMFGTEVASARVGRYLLGTRLGHGAAGCVHRGIDPTLKRPVAIKLIAIPHELDEAQCDALMAEARALAATDHRCLVKVHDAGTCALGDITGSMALPAAIGMQRTIYMVMELVEGPSLGEWLAAGRSHAEVVATFLALGEALEAAHRSGIVHRDFKPSNIAFDATGTPKILDFGLAGPAETEHAVGGGASLGTPAYMAPEQHDGALGDARADQFAYCVTLWEALARARPFAGPSMEDFARQKLGGEIVAGGRVRGAVRRVAARGLRPDPDARWPTMAELVRELRWAARRRAVVATAVTAAAASAIVLASTTADDRCASSPGGRETVVWSAEHRERLDEAIRGQLPFGAAGVVEVVDSRFGALDEQWHVQHEQACRGAEGERLAMFACLDDAAAAARGVFQALVRHPGSRAVELLDLLPAPTDCPTPGSAPAAGLASHREELTLYRSRFRLGQMQPVVEHAREVLERDGLPDAVRAEWLMLQGLTLEALAHHDEARDALRRAWTLAEQTGHSHLAVGAVLALSASTMATDPKQALTLLEVAEATRGSLGRDRQVALDATWAHYHVNVSGDLDAAMERWRAVIGNVAQMEFVSSTSVATAAGLAKLLIRKGEFDAARDELDRVLGGAGVDRSNAFVVALVLTRGEARWLSGDLEGAALDLAPAVAEPLPGTAVHGLELHARVVSALGSPESSADRIAKHQTKHRTKHPDAALDGDPTLVARAGLALFRGELSAATRFPAPRDFEGADWELELLAVGRAIVGGQSELVSDGESRLRRRSAGLPPWARQLLALDTSAVIGWTGDVEQCVRWLEMVREAPSLHLRTRAELVASRVALRAGDDARAGTFLQTAHSLIRRYPEPWVAGEVELALLEAVATSREGDPTRALQRAEGALARRDGRATLGLVEAAALLAAEPDAALSQRAAAWAHEIGDAVGADAELVSWLLARPASRRP
ncbi:MAG: serine/threonine-protein kinase [Myxococcota bacterium]